MSENQTSEYQQSTERYLNSPNDCFDNLGTPLKSDWSKSQAKDEEGIPIVSSKKNINDNNKIEQFELSPNERETNEEKNEGNIFKYLIFRILHR